MKHQRPLATFVLLLLHITCGNADEGQIARQEATLVAQITADGYKLTQGTTNAFVVLSKARAQANLEASGIQLPADLLAWVESEPEIWGCVYGTRAHQADRMLQALHSLRMDLGKETFVKYPQLVLAAAVAQSFDPDKEIDLSERPPVRLEIGGDPRILVNTKDPGRELDMNDHIINFLDSHTIEEEVVVGSKKAEFAELNYDENGIAIGQTTPKKKNQKPQNIERRKRPLVAADVLASKELQTEFNAYMKSKGVEIEIDCSDQAVHWDSHDMVKGSLRGQIAKAYELFRDAYRAKGLLPQDRDPIPTIGERCAYLVRNFEWPFTEEERQKLQWPRFSLHSPWPLLIMLVQNDQPLREREERWEEFIKKGKIPTYGEYIGGIAQQYDMQSARRLSPYPFYYGSVQMMLKDGGVCGAMANIGARSYVTMGIPSCTAGQPGHCALVMYKQDPKSGSYACKGGQYATGGDDKTTPHAPWVFEDAQKTVSTRNGKESVKYPRRPMVYHQSTAWAVNQGMDAFNRSTIAYRLFQLLPEEQQKAYGILMLYSGLALNPYNMLLIDAAQEVAGQPGHQMLVWKQFEKTLQDYQPKGDAPTKGLYPDFIRDRMFRNIAKLPPPENPEEAKKVLKFLQENECTDGAAITKYQVALQGIETWQGQLLEEFKKHLADIRAQASPANDTAAQFMDGQITFILAAIQDRNKRKLAAQTFAEAATGKEMYFGNRTKLSVHPAMAKLYRAAGKKLPDNPEMAVSMMVYLETEAHDLLTNGRTQENTKALAIKLRSTLAQLPDDDAKQTWAGKLLQHFEGKEKFSLTTKGKTKQIPDPCLVEIKKYIQ
jgi:hypothetical protein